MSQTQRIALFPGTFDPITNGHLDVIARAAKLFDELVVAIGENPDKSAMLERAERLEILREATAEMPNVRVDSYTGLTMEFARRIGASTIVRGVRNSSDMEAELQMALANRVVAEVETVFIMTDPQHAFTSSSLIRQIASMGGDVSALVPPQVMSHIHKLRGT